MTLILRIADGDDAIWAKSVLQTEEVAKEMFHRGDDDDETDETDAEVSDQYVSE